MFNLTGSELVVILLIALVVLGPEKLPEAIRRAGRLYSELRRMSSGFQEEFTTALREPLKEMRSTSEMLNSALRFDAGAEPASADPPPRESGPADQSPGADDDSGVTAPDGAHVDVDGLDATGDVGDTSESDRERDRP